MASIETHTAPRPLSPADLDGALRLSVAAQWNQNLDDWSMMLRLGRGWGIDAINAINGTQAPAQPGPLAASVIVLPYGEHFAWVSMVLVHPDHRRRGHAQTLLRHALVHLAARGMGAVLDATPAGHAVYLQESFCDTWGFARYRREAAAPPPMRPAGPPTRPLLDRDWPAIDAMDTHAFGASRLPLLRELAARWPQAARVVEVDGQLRGFMLGRTGREAHQIGPLLAQDDACAMALLHDALHAAPAALYVDLLDRQRALLPWLQEQGFVFQRPFTRMVHGLAAAPGEPSAIVLSAGPELG